MTAGLYVGPVVAEEARPQVLRMADGSYRITRQHPTKIKIPTLSCHETLSGSAR